MSLTCVFFETWDSHSLHPTSDVTKVAPARKSSTALGFQDRSGNWFLCAMQPSCRGAGRLLCGTLAWLPEPVGVQGQQVGCSAKVTRKFSVPQVCKVSEDALPIVESAVLEASDVVAVEQICSGLSSTFLQCPCTLQEARGRPRCGQFLCRLMQMTLYRSKLKRETSYRLTVAPFLSKVWCACPLAHEVESSSCSNVPRMSKILNVIGVSFLLCHVNAPL